MGNLLSAEPVDSRIKEQPMRYAGYVYDAETKQYYLQARYYDPATARFISRDPDLGPSYNTYGDDNPITKTDPDGKRVWLVINAGFAAYDGYKVNFIPIGKVKRVYRAVKIAKGLGKSN
ncbi:RHS repeat-associated core domain-containing protein [Lysinibacillus sp. NPDC086135]|uniref:RHS repeat-associated core domain-containing protein n=1 Tax=Lysinibacillus sp. NPDC086135 TaxID=3364130 RepID=UPI00382025BF